MDCRDITQEPEEVKGGKYLEKVYTLQKVLLDHYIGIEGLPSYPINVNTKSSQTLLKDFTGRVTEELAEGFESHLMVLEIMEKHGFNLDTLTQEEYETMISHLQNLNEEQADAMHFMVELLIYANIQPEDIRSWVEKKFKEMGMTHICNGDIIDYTMACGAISARENLPIGPSAMYSVLDTDTITDHEKAKFVPGGRYICREFVMVTRSPLWDITFALNISRNCLKNKPWKQSGVMTNETLYQSKLVEAFVYMMGYYSLLGMTSHDVYYLYFKKNRVNQFRIKSNY